MGQGQHSGGLGGGARRGPARPWGQPCGVTNLLTYFTQARQRRKQKAVDELRVAVLAAPRERSKEQVWQ